MSHHDYFNAKSELKIGGKTYTYYRLADLENLGPVSSLPYSIKVLLEAAVRQCDGKTITQEHVEKLANWAVNRNTNQDVPFKPARIILQDFTGVPAVVDLAAMRSTMDKIDGDVSKINPLVPVDLVIDHSVMVDNYGSEEALALNEAREFERNAERYRFLRWAQSAFDNFRTIPPSTGIIHQVNLEYLASVAATKEVDGETQVFPDSLVGTDSHTTMINGLGIVGWGVGGIEAEAGMLGQPLYFLMPDVLGFKLTGALAEGATATDLALTVTNLLRTKGVVNKFVEFFGPGMSNMSLADRATVANMSPEYGATIGFFPVDQETLNYLRLTGRSEEQIELVETYYKAQGMFLTPDSPEPTYSEVIELDLSTVVPSLAGPKRPQDRVDLTEMKQSFNEVARSSIDEGGYGLSEKEMNKEAELKHPTGETTKLRNGSVVLAAITSCTNTSNPSVLIGAGLVAKKAIAKGLIKPAYVKTSLTPGSRVVTDYLLAAGLAAPLDQLGFQVAGYGCATCIGNSGPLPIEVSEAILNEDLTVAGVLSGNRNFEGRIHAEVKANYLASPPLVIAYALAGTVDIDFATEPIGYDKEQQPVYLKDIWPTSKEIEDTLSEAVRPELFRERYKDVFSANQLWNDVKAPEGALYEWDSISTYIAEPPFFQDISEGKNDISDISGARALAVFGDSVTTDHISPAGSILSNTPAGQYLQENGVKPEDFNSYGSRRGNHEVMLRGTFANNRIRNHLAPGTEGGFTKYLPNDEIMSIYDASLKYQANNIPLIVIAGKEYGTGSSRDWAAKGPLLLGVKAVISESFERIHRSNLVGMGILPLQFPVGMNAENVGITGAETFHITGLTNEVKPGQTVIVKATREDGSHFEFDAIIRLDSLIDIEYYRNGGILQTVFRQLAKE